MSLRGLGQIWVVPPLNPSKFFSDPAFWVLSYNWSPPFVLPKLEWSPLKSSTPPHPRAINYARSLNLNCPTRIPVTFIWDRVPPRVEPMVCRLIVHALPRCIVFPHRKPISSKRKKKWACFTKIRWYTRFHWVSHGPKEARKSQRTNKLWRSPLLVYPGHSTPGYLNSSKKAISVLFQSPKFQSAKPFLLKGVLFAREENRKS